MSDYTVDCEVIFITEKMKKHGLLFLEEDGSQSFHIEFAERSGKELPSKGKHYIRRWTDVATIQWNLAKKRVEKQNDD